MKKSIRSYRDLIVWQKARQLAVLVYRTTGSFPRSDAYGLGSQMQRSAISIASNIAEGHERDGSNEFRHFLSIAFASGAELETQLEIARELGKIGERESNEIAELLSEIMRMLNVLIKKIKMKI